jgi:hypothetical protein
VTPTERKEVVTPATEHKAPFVPPREVHVTQPERVKIPAPPIVGRQARQDAVEKGPPARPADEQKHKAEVKAETKDTHKTEVKSEVKDTHKDEGEHKSN